MSESDRRWRDVLDAIDAYGDSRQAQTDSSLSGPALRAAIRAYGEAKAAEAEKERK